MFIDPELVKTVNLPDGNWIKLRQVTFEEKIRAAAAYAESPILQAVAIVKISIVEWSKPIPVTPDQIALLDDASWQALFTAINTPDEAEGKGEGRSAQ